jgi:lipoate-protein ligase B
MALNVNLSLKPFNWINPCGLQNIKMTSIQQELSHSVPMPLVKQSLKKHFQSIFGIKIAVTEIKELYRDFKLSA